MDKTLLAQHLETAIRALKDQAGYEKGRISEIDSELTFFTGDHPAAIEHHKSMAPVRNRWEKCLADTRATLAFFERLAAVRVEFYQPDERKPGFNVHTQMQDGGIPCCFVDPSFDEFNLEDYGLCIDYNPVQYAEHQALCLLAASLECRRRNGEVG